MMAILEGIREAHTLLFSYIDDDSDPLDAEIHPGLKSISEPKWWFYLILCLPRVQSEWKRATAVWLVELRPEEELWNQLWWAVCLFFVVLPGVGGTSTLCPSSMRVTKKVFIRVSGAIEYLPLRPSSLAWSFPKRFSHLNRNKGDKPSALVSLKLVLGEGRKSHLRYYSYRDWS